MHAVARFLRSCFCQTVLASTAHPGMRMLGYVAALVSGLIFASPATEASAEIITVTYTGIVTGGWDTTGVFGSTAANAYVGDTYTEVFKFDSTLGSTSIATNSTQYAGNYSLSGGPNNPDHSVSPAISVTMTLNGHSYTLGGDSSGLLTGLNIPPGFGEQSELNTTLADNGIGSASAHLTSPNGGNAGVPASIFIPYTYVAQAGDDGNADFLLAIGPSGLDVHTLASEVQLSVSDSVGAVPEPSTWAMMVLGFAGIGFMAYRRKVKPQNQWLADPRS